MKSFAVLICSVFLALAQTGPAQTSPADQENAAKAKAVLDQAIEALGGQAYLSFQDRSEEGRFYTFYHGESNSVGAPYELRSKFPDKDRMEVLHMKSYHFYLFDIGNLPAKDKQDIVVIHNGDRGYEITYKGTTAENPDEKTKFLRRRRHSLDWVLRKWIHEPGVALFYEGHTVAAQKEAEQVTVMNTNNEAVTLYFDSNTHLPLKKSYSWRDPKDKERNIEEEIYDSYRLTQGIMAPFSVTRFYNGDMTYQRFIATIAFNKSLPDSLFEANVSYDPAQGAHR